MAGAESLAPLDKGVVRRNWDIRAAAWNRWAEVMEKVAGRFNEPLLDAAEVASGHRVLDLASGVGEPALSCARRIGPEGVVTATDMSPDMLDGARRRAAAAELDTMRFEIADMEALPFADESFDEVICRFGIMFCPDPAAALAEARRVLVAGGRTAWMVWGPMEDTTIFAVIQSRVRAALGLAPDPNLAQFRFAAPGLLAGLMTDAGLGDVAERELRLDARPAAGSKFWRANMEMSFAEELADATPAQRAEVERQVEAGFAEYLKDGAYHITAHARIGVGRRPAA